LVFVVSPQGTEIFVADIRMLDQMVDDPGDAVGNGHRRLVVGPQLIDQFFMLGLIERSLLLDACIGRLNQEFP